MSISSNVIGEGAYGCIHKPSLTCKDAKVQNYKNKVSKVLQREKAKLELAEYSSIEDADAAHEYYLGQPIECEFDNSPSNIQAVEKCKNGPELLKNLNDLSLLIMEDGGMNLKEFADLMETWPSRPENTEKTEQFFIELHRIFHGCSVFTENGILHFDMKPQNIVYNPKTNPGSHNEFANLSGRTSVGYLGNSGERTSQEFSADGLSNKENEQHMGRMNIIDFGLSVSLKDKLAQINNNANNMARYHWSYPLEFFFLNKDTYENFSKMTRVKKEKYYNSILQEIATEYTDTSNAIRAFFYFIMDQTSDSEIFKQQMSGFYQTIVIEMTSRNYPMFVKKSLTSVDVYGLGIVLLYTLKKTKRLLKPQLYTDLYNLGINMINAQLSKRISSTDALGIYETILTENGIMSKHRLSFADHKIVKGEPIPQNIEQNIETTIDSIKIDITDPKLEKQAVSVDISQKQPMPAKTFNASKRKKPRKKTLKKRVPKRSINPKKQTDFLVV